MCGPSCLPTAFEPEAGHGEEALRGEPGELQETVHQTAVEGKTWTLPARMDPFHKSTYRRRSDPVWSYYFAFHLIFLDFLFHSCRSESCPYAITSRE